MTILAFAFRLSLGKGLSNCVLGCEASMLCTLKSKKFRFWSSQHTHAHTSTDTDTHTNCKSLKWADIGRVFLQRRH